MYVNLERDHFKIRTKGPLHEESGESFLHWAEWKGRPTKLLFQAVPQQLLLRYIAAAFGSNFKGLPPLLYSLESKSFFGWQCSGSGPRNGRKDGMDGWTDDEKRRITFSDFKLKYGKSVIVQTVRGTRHPFREGGKVERLVFRRVTSLVPSHHHGKKVKERRTKGRKLASPPTLVFFFFFFYFPILFLFPFLPSGASLVGIGAEKAREWLDIT